MQVIQAVAVKVSQVQVHLADLSRLFRPRLQKVRSL